MKNTPNKTAVEITPWQARNLCNILADYTARLDEDARYCADSEEVASLDRRGKLAVRLHHGIEGAMKRAADAAREEKNRVARNKRALRREWEERNGPLGKG